MKRLDLLLDLIRTRNVVALVALAGLVIAGGMFLRNRRSAWLVLFFGLLAAAVGYGLRGCAS